MTMGTGLFLIAVGAILRYAIQDDLDAINLETVGLILIIVGAVAFIVGAIYAFGVRDRHHSYRDRDAPPRDPGPPREPRP